MLRGRYGVGWMVTAGAALVAVIGLCIWGGFLIAAMLSFGLSRTFTPKFGLMCRPWTWVDHLPTWRSWHAHVALLRPQLGSATGWLSQSENSASQVRGPRAHSRASPIHHRC